MPSKLIALFVSVVVASVAIVWVFVVTPPAISRMPIEHTVVRASKSDQLNSQRSNDVPDQDDVVPLVSEELEDQLNSTNDLQASVEGAGLSARILLPNGRVALGARVHLSGRSGGCSAATIENEAIANANGQITFTELPNNWTYSLRVQRAGCAQEFVEIPILYSGESINVGDIHLRPASVVFGKVRDSSGRGVPDVGVSWFRSGAGEALTPARSGLDGAFRFEDLGSGDYCLYADGYSGRCFEMPTFRLSSGEKKRVDIEACDGQEFFGQVLSASGAPVPMATVTLSSQAGDSSKPTATTDSRGRFCFFGLDEDYDRLCVVKGWVDVATEADSLATLSKVITLPESGDIEIVARTARDQTVVCGAWGFLEERRVEATEAGVLLFTDVPVGVADIFVRADGYRDVQCVLEAKNGQRVTHRVEFEPLDFELNVSVRDKAGEPVENAIVRLESQQGITDGSGLCAVMCSRALDRGPRFIHINAAGFAPKQFAWNTGEITGELLELELQRAAGLRVQVIEPLGQQLNWLRVELENCRDHSGKWGYGGRVAARHRQGSTFEFGELHPRDCTLSVQDEETGYTVLQPVHLASELTCELTVEFPESFEVIAKVTSEGQPLPGGSLYLTASRDSARVSLFAKEREPCVFPIRLRFAGDYEIKFECGGQKLNWQVTIARQDETQVIDLQ